VIVCVTVGTFTFLTGEETTTFYTFFTTGLYFISTISGPLLFSKLVEAGAAA